MLRYVLLVSKQSAWEHKTRKLFFPSFRFWFFPPISSVHTYSWNPFSQELQKFSARIHYKFKKTLFRLPTPETSLWTGETQIARLIGKMLLKKRTEFISWIVPIRKDDLLCSLGLVRFNLGTQTKKTCTISGAFRYCLPVSLSTRKFHNFRKKPAKVFHLESTLSLKT